MGKLYIIILLSLLCSTVILSQTSEDDPMLYIYVDELPRLNYDGGLKKYINDNLQWPGQFGSEGYVLVSFVVQTNGTVKDLKEEIRYCSPQCFEEIQRLFESMLEWKPGILDSKEVDVKLYLPVKFKISK